MESYNTLSEALNGLKKEGYTEDFNLKQDCIECGEGKYKLLAGDFNVDKLFRFEGESNPDDEEVVYAISSVKHGLKGTLVNAFGIYSEPVTDELTEKLRINH